MPERAETAPARVDAQREAWWRRLLLRVGTAAGVLRVTVPNGAASVTVRFPRTESTDTYGVLLTPSWNTTAWPSALTRTGFTLHLGTAPTGAQRCTVMIVREG